MSIQISPKTAILSALAVNLVIGWLLIEGMIKLAKTIGELWIGG